MTKTAREKMEFISANQKGIIYMTPFPTHSAATRMEAM